jgi:hypothetical protein
MKQIVGSNNRKVTLIKMALPIDADGEYAFDEDGKPIEGHKPFILTVPRFDTIDRDTFKEINAALAALDDKHDPDDDDDTGEPKDKSWQILSTMLKPFVTEDDIQLVARLKRFEWDQIAEHWQQQSTISLGE